MVRLSFSGTYLSAQEAQMMRAQGHKDEQQILYPRNLKLKSIHDDEFDPELREKLLIINQQKDDAVANEDFDMAIELKDICDKLKMIGSDLSVLERRKVEAIANEDFESAKALK